MFSATTISFILLVLLTSLTLTRCHPAKFKVVEKNKKQQKSFSHGHGLYFDSSDVPALRAKANTTHRLIYEHICKLSDGLKSHPDRFLPPVDSKTFVSRWNEKYGNWLAVLAFYSVLQPADSRVFDLLVTFMDRMVDYPTWFVDPAPTDEVPVSHSLTGMATAFDFLKDRLTNKQQQRYASKIYDVTKNLYDFGQNRWWGRTYIQNHVASITMAILNGAIVLQSYHKEETSVWRKWAFGHLKKTLVLLDTVIDGSMNEGTAYGTYTTRSLTQFLFVAKRHYNIDLTNFWVKQHYDFLLGTTLPGYSKVIGIADSNPDWFYGPESQLAFLETFVLNNGEANWLISKIRSAKRKSSHFNFGRYCTEHTEFLWYNASIREQSPFLGERARSKLFRFSDAGIVTYGAGRDSNETLLSFKSGPLHGRAVYVAIEKKLFPWLDSWKKLNPGHEHPDQNSFVFYPRGKPMITEALYGPKFTFLNNGLMFGPSPFAKHFPPFEGQLGEAFKWLNWKSEGLPHAWAEVVTAVEDKGMVLFSGEAVGAYHDHLQLKSVYRALVLLNPDILLVMDHIELSPGSVLKYTNSYFNNMHHPFKVNRPLRSGANAVLEGEDGEEYEIRWASVPDKLLSVNSGIHSQTLKSPRVKSELHFLNLSIPLSSSITRAVYVFSGPRAQVRSVGFSEVSDNGVRLSVRTEEGEYSIALVTNYSDVLARHQFLGTLGYGLVKEPGSYVHTFAAKPIEENSTEKLMVSFNEEAIQQQPEILQDDWTFYAIVLGCCSVNFLFMWAILSRFRRRRLKTKYFSAQKVAKFGFLLLLLISLGVLAFFGIDYSYDVQSTAHVHLQNKPPLPSVFVSTLGNYGSSLVVALFQNSSDFTYVPPSFPAGKLSDVVDKREMLIGHLDITSSAFHSRGQISQLYAITTEKLNQLKQHWLKYPNAMMALHTEEPRCLSVFSLQSVAFNHSLKFIHVAVRDPAKWVASQMAQITEIVDYQAHFRDLLFAESCTDVSMSPPEYRQLLDYLESDDNLPLHRILAMIWRASSALSQRLSEQLHPSSYLRVHFEDIIRNPVETAAKIYSFLGLPLPLSTEFHILQHTKSSVYSKVSKDTTWKSTELTAEQIHDINTICLHVL